MSYNAFLMAMSQWSHRKKAHVVVQEHLIGIEIGEKNRWTFSTKVFQAEEGLSSHAYLSSMGNLRWQSQGPYLKRDPHTDAVFLMYEAHIETGKYIPFRQHLQAFLQAVEEWEEILHHATF